MHEPRTFATSADEVALYHPERGPRAIGQELTTTPGAVEIRGDREVLSKGFDVNTLDPIDAPETRAALIRFPATLAMPDGGEVAIGNSDGLHVQFPAFVREDPLQGSDRVERQANTFRIEPDAWDREYVV